MTLGYIKDLEGTSKCMRLVLQRRCYGDAFLTSKNKLPCHMVPKMCVSVCVWGWGGGGFKEEFPNTPTEKIQKFLLRYMAKSLG